MDQLKEKGVDGFVDNAGATQALRSFSSTHGAFLGILQHALPIHFVSNGRIVRVRCTHHRHNISAAAAAAVRMVRQCRFRDVVRVDRRCRSKESAPLIAHPGVDTALVSSSAQPPSVRKWPSAGSYYIVRRRGWYNQWKGSSTGAINSFGAKGERSLYIDFGMTRPFTLSYDTCANEDLSIHLIEVAAVAGLLLVTTAASALAYASRFDKEPQHTCQYTVGTGSTVRVGTPTDSEGGVGWAAHPPEDRVTA
ncbi:hypothetical protein BJV78DRAFT_1158891 [Lactifluus subvellereus]|nr:hypothetical protein BJV78DRAFT_1158891 [Lactifluus subvellereus]